MKIRQGFVSNSSASSFILYKPGLSEKQIDMVLYYKDYIKSFIEEDMKERLSDYYYNSCLKDEFDPNRRDTLAVFFEYYDFDWWLIENHNDYITGETSMANFNLEDFFKYIKLDPTYYYFDDVWSADNDIFNDFLIKCRSRLRKEKIENIEKNSENV